MFLIDTSRNSRGFLKLYTLKIVLKRLLFSEQITMDSVPNLKEKDKFLNSCCVAWKRSKSNLILFKEKNTSYGLFLERLKSVHSLLLYQRNNNIIWQPRITKPQRLIYVILGRQAGQFSFKTVLVALLLLQLWMPLVTFSDPRNFI